MGKFVIVIDVSGSMFCKLKNLIRFLGDWIPLKLKQVTNEIALVSFSDNVQIDSQYTSIPQDLVEILGNIFKNREARARGSSVLDAIIEAAGISPTANEIYVFSDFDDNESKASAEDCAKELHSKEVGKLTLVPPLDIWEDPACPNSNAFKNVFISKPYKLIKYSQAKENALSLADEIRKTKKEVRVFNPNALLP